MQLKGLESLSIIKKKMEEEQHENGRDKQTPKHAASIDESQRRAFDKKEHKAQLKAAKEEYRKELRCSTNNNTRILLSDLESLASTPKEEARENSLSRNDETESQRIKENNKLIAEQQRIKAEARREEKRRKVQEELQAIRNSKQIRNENCSGQKKAKNFVLR